MLGGSVDGTVRQFDVRMGMMFTDTLHEAVTGIAVSHDGNCVLASCLDNSMRLLDKASGEQLASYTGVIGAICVIKQCNPGCSSVACLSCILPAWIHGSNDDHLEWHAQEMMHTWLQKTQFTDFEAW